jgi:hypothetical protein
MQQCCATSLLGWHWHPSEHEHVIKPFDLRYPSFHQREMLSRYRFSQASVGSSVTCCHLFVFFSQFAVGAIDRTGAARDSGAQDNEANKQSLLKPK